MHAPPFVALGVHTPPLHQSPPMQSVSVAQELLHAFVPQTYGVQAVVTGAGQCPCPSQLAAAVCVPFAQLAPRHCDVG